MNTKHILMMGALAVSALTFTSCDDFFDTSSKTDLNTETAYSNLESAEMALIGCYDGWQRTISDAGVGMYLLAEFASEQALGGLGLSDAKNNNVIDQFNLGIAPSYNDLFNTDWVNYYNAIYRCNQLITQEANINWGGDTAAQGRVIGEARAIRGILYFDLARMFGDVPLLTAPSEDNIPRSAASEVYQVIFDDLKFAAENIPADAYPLENRNSNDGRITKYAAEALLARAYLYYTGYYGAEHAGCTKAEAVAAINDVVENGGYELEANYADFWMPSCTTDGSSGGEYGWNTTYAGKWYDGSTWQAGQGSLSKEIVLNLKMNTTHDYNGNGDGLTFSVYLGPRNKCATSVCIASGWGACPVTQAFVDQYEEDPRFSACVWSCDEAGFEADLTDTYEYTGYYTRKYAPMCFADGTRQEVGFQLGEQHMNITYYQDYTIMRYADVLLMHSELNGTADGLNAVHQRVYPGESLTYSLENIRNERAIELAFEGVHYWDLMRYEKDGAYAARVIAAAQNGAQVTNGGVAATTTFTESNFTSKKGLMQIPNTQITLSGSVLTQNAGW
ncbi:MAG: RagB/SusD family nutrient uptake outer membrane protein [Bacteroides sp.]|nr:RagB/SusD family nutrient uptake outer membrane protein [Bacteroides sp.]